MRGAVPTGDPVVCTIYTIILLKREKSWRETMWEKRALAGRDREGPVESQEKQLVTLHRVIHCATEIITKHLNLPLKPPGKQEEEII